MKVRRNAKLYEGASHLQLHTTDQLYVQNSADLQHCILLQEKVGHKRGNIGKYCRD